MWACAALALEIVSSTDTWLLLGAACLDLCTAGFVLYFPSQEASWGDLTHLIPVQVCGKTGEFYRCESGI